MNKMQR